MNKRQLKKKERNNNKTASCVATQNFNDSAGVFVGIKGTTPVFFNIFNKPKNSNMFVLGVAGAGRNVRVKKANFKND